MIIEFKPPDSAALNALGADQVLVKKALVRAANRTAVSLRAVAVKEVRSRYAIKAKDIRDNLKLRRAKESDVDPKATLFASEKRGIPLIKFRVGSKAVPSTRWAGVSGEKRARGKVYVKVTRARKQVKGGFAAKMKSGHIGIFIRDPNKRMRKKKKQAIRELFGPSATVLLGKAGVITRLNKDAEALMRKNVDREAGFILLRR